MAEKKFDAQVNYGWGLSLNMTGKAPAVAKRIFDTYADALAYANDVNDSAIEGLVLSVVADTAELNGAYFVQQVAKPAIEADEEKGIEAADAVAAVLVKLSSADGASGDTAAALQAAKDYTDQEVKELADGAVSANTAAINVLNGDAETEGSVAKAVADEKALREAAEKAITDRLAVIEGEAEGSVKKALADAKVYADNKVAALDATITGEGTYVDVTVSQVDGVITAVTIAENDIASASGVSAALSAETAAREAADNAIKDIIGSGFTSANTVADAIAANTNAIAALDAEVTSEGGKHVAVKVTEVDGVITAVNVTETDIASASALTAEVTAREEAISALTKTVSDNKTELNDAITANTSAIDAIEADYLKAADKTELNNAITAETKNRQDADKAINDKIGDVAEGKTVVEMIAEAQAAAEAAATIITEKAEGHVTVSGVQDKTTGAWTYTIAENDIASADVLAEVKEDVDNFFKDASFAESAKDTLKELQEYITSDAAGALAMEEAIADNKKAIEDEVTRAEAKELELSNAITAETKARQDAIAALDAVVTSTDGSHVTVKVTEVDGVITAVNVTESDIASATGLTAETNRAISAETANANAISAETAAREADVEAINEKIGEVASGKTVVGMIAEAQTAAEDYANSAVTTAKSELLGDAAEDYNTLGKLEDKIIAAETAAKAAATKLVEEGEGHVTVSGVQDATTGAWTYTIAENDIASASALTAETAAREKAIADVKSAYTAADAELDVKISANTTAIANEVKAREDADKAINDKIGEVASSKTVVEMIEDAQDYADTQIKTEIEKLDSSVNNGDDATVKVSVEQIDGKLTGVSADLYWGTF